MKIIPTIFEKDFLKAEAKIKLVKDMVSWVQIDVTDGYFVDGKTFELELLTKIDGIESSLLDIHLMVKNPSKWINKCIFCQASRIIGQVETMSDRNEFVKEIKDEGLEAGLAFDIDTKIDDNIPQDTDIVLLMARKAGFGKYVFENKIYEKIAKLKKIRQDLSGDFLIGVDGGINRQNIRSLFELGVDIGYCGSAVFEGDVSANIKYLENNAN